MPVAHCFIAIALEDIALRPCQAACEALRWACAHLCEFGHVHGVGNVWSLLQFKGSNSCHHLLRSGLRQEGRVDQNSTFNLSRL